jgi:uncharacterized protein (DUF2236 family)
MPDGYFNDESTLRRINRERVVALSGPRALLMQAAHPLAVSGLLAHTSGLDEPYERLERTAEVMNAIAFGTRDDADRMSATVRTAHNRVRGRLKESVGSYPAGTPYRADDPELLMWVLFTLVDSALVVYRLYVGELSRSAEAAYWEDYKVIGELFGLHRADMPDSLDQLDEYRREMLEGNRLFVNEWARTTARRIVFDPPVPLVVRPLLETANFITIALLPARIRKQYGFAPLPPTVVRSAMVRGGAEYVKRVLLPLLPSRLRFVPGAQAA